MGRPLSATDLQRALEEAYKQVAVALMYNRGEVPDTGWEQLTLAAAEPWTYVVPDGRLPPLLVLSLLLLWALGCMVLGVAYSFRRRWGAYFSVKSLYWYCKTTGLDPVDVMKG
jgi:hypothetical protein